METFPTGSEAYIPSVGMERDRSFRDLKAGFGDGYEQIAGDGINTDVDTYQLEWRDLPSASAGVIVAFFDARKTNEAFNWTPPFGTSGVYRLVRGYKCRYDKVMNVYTIRAQFKTAFDN